MGDLIIHTFIGTMIKYRSHHIEIMGPTLYKSTNRFTFFPSKKTVNKLAAGCNDQIHSPTTHRHCCFMKDLLGAAGSERSRSSDRKV